MPQNIGPLHVVRLTEVIWDWAKGLGRTELIATWPGREEYGNRKNKLSLVGCS